MNSRWQTQQQQKQQQPEAIIEKDVTSISKEVAIWESRARVRDDKKQPMGVDQASRKWVQDTSEMDIDAHRSKEEINTDTILEGEVVEEEITDANKEAIEKIKKGSNTICIREDPSKEKMVFSEESRPPIFDMGNVEHIEIKTSRIQCPSCLHHVSKEQFSAHAASPSCPIRR